MRIFFLYSFFYLGNLNHVNVLPIQDINQINLYGPRNLHSRGTWLILFIHFPEKHPVQSVFYAMHFGYFFSKCCPTDLTIPPATFSSLSIILLMFGSRSIVGQNYVEKNECWYKDCNFKFEF